MTNIYVISFLIKHDLKPKSQIEMSIGNRSEQAIELIKKRKAQEKITAWGFRCIKIEELKTKLKEYGFDLIIPENSSTKTSKPILKHDEEEKIKSVLDE